jgi:cytochrome c1
MSKTKEEWNEVSGEFGKSVRWTEEAKSTWEGENSVYVGDEIHGLLDSKREGVGDNAANIYEIMTTDHGMLSVWDTTVLRDKMTKVMIGQEVKIVYKGETKPKGGGKPYKTFAVFYKDPSDDFLKEINLAKVKAMSGAEEVAVEDIPM